MSTGVFCSKLRCVHFLIAILLAVPSILASANEASGVPSRLVVLAPDIAENLVSLNQADRIVGWIPAANVPEILLNKPVVGDHQTIQIEQILSLRPDLIIAWSEGNSARDLQRLEQLGIAVERLSTRRLADLPAQLRQLGALLDIPERGEQLASDFESEIAKYRSEVQLSQVRVFYLLWDDPLLTVNGSSLISEIIELCGGVNLFEEATMPAPQVQMESVIAARPELVLASDALGPEWKVDWSRWTDLSAVRENQLYSVDSDLLHRLTLRTIQGVERVCSLITQARERRKVD